MAFQLPPLPSFSPQVPDITGKALEGAQLRNMMSEMALRQALAPSQVQQAQAQAQQAQQQAEMGKMQLQGQQALTDWIKNGDTNADISPDQFKLNDKIATLVGVDPKDPIMQVVRSMAQHGVPAPMLMAEAQQMLQRRTEYNKGTEEQQKIIKDNYDVFKDATAQIFNAPKDEWSPRVAAALPRLMQATHLSPELAQAVSMLQQDPQNAVPMVYNMVAAQDKALALGKAAAEKTAAEQKVINPATGMSPEQEAEVNKQVAVETNPQVQAGKLALATAEARAREQVQASMLPLLEDIRQQYANQKDARDKIDSTVLKPFQEKMTDITTARQAIAQAADNPVAARAAVFKMIGVAQPTGSHRVIPAEISAFKYPGGITDQIQERFKGFLTGEPWTPEIAQAANAFIDGQASAAQTNLNSGIDRTNKLYGTTVGRGLQQAPATVNPPAGPQPSGKAVSLKAAMQLPMNKGKTEAEVRADIESHGHAVRD